MTVIPSGLSIAASNPTTAPPRSNAALGQQDFLTLLTTQLRNQDPLKPMENGEFLGQMAQFSTVSGIDRVNETLGSLGAGMRDMRIAMVSNLLGHSVLVPGTVTRPDSDGAIRGAIDLPEAVDAVQIPAAARSCTARLSARSGRVLSALNGPMCRPNWWLAGHLCACRCRPCAEPIPNRWIRWSMPACCRAGPGPPPMTSPFRSRISAR
jgi:Flagellar hook capping protein - N-terminal region